MESSAESKGIPCLGYSQTLFHPDNPDRLCRGREQWIPALDNTEEGVLYRTVLSGSLIVDDGARNIQRGVRCTGKTMGAVIRALFPSDDIVAWGEEQEPSTVPADANGIELYQISRIFAPFMKWSARFEKKVEASEIDALVDSGVDAFLINPCYREESEAWEKHMPYPPLVDEERKPPILTETLRKGMYALVGQRAGNKAIARFQPKALEDVLQHCDALVLLHSDKHDYCLGIYSLDERDLDIDVIEESLSVLMIPFSIPPMLARWDRAIADLRKKWNKEAPFPIPSSQEESESESEEEPEEEPDV